MARPIGHPFERPIGPRSVPYGGRIHKLLIGDRIGDALALMEESRKALLNRIETTDASLANHRAQRAAQYASKTREIMRPKPMRKTPTPTERRLTTRIAALTTQLRHLEFQKCRVEQRFGKL